MGPLPEHKDRLLEFAYTLYVEGMCDCGRPKSECRNEANIGQYEVASVICHAQAAIEEHTGQQGFKAEPGERFYATEIDDELVVRRKFAPLPNPDDRGNEPGQGNDDGEPA